MAPLQEVLAGAATGSPGLPAGLLINSTVFLLGIQILLKGREPCPSCAAATLAICVPFGRVLLVAQKRDPEPRVSGCLRRPDTSRGCPFLGTGHCCVLCLWAWGLCHGLPVLPTGLTGATLTDENLHCIETSTIHLHMSSASPWFLHSPISIKLGQCLLQDASLQEQLGDDACAGCVEPVMQGTLCCCR